ncbi:MAG: LacI family DNA-binding transcriptional regulator [Anaerolineales bacterium]|nr:LacI family DNA-binding transcriptional regulator [Anaerolineales bacterium]
MTRATIYDIAKEAGVSPSTVSRALQDHPRIGVKTRARIQALAKSMGYVPSAVAKSLTTNKTWTIGIIITTVADPVLADIVDGIEAVAQEAGYSIFLSYSHNNPERELKVIEIFQRRRVDAIINIASLLGRTHKAALEELTIPIVLVENQGYRDYYHQISTDSFGGAKMAVEHLIGLDHQRIGFVGANDRPFSSNERLAGYKKALEQANIPLMPELITIPEANNDYERGQIGLANILAAQPTAVFCYNDRTAIGVMKECERQNIAIPQQLSIVGFDDIMAVSFLRPSLTTIRQPRVQMGKFAMQMILDLLDGQMPSPCILPVELVVRQTTTHL